MKTRNIMIVGVGGQGTLIASRILGYIATAAGYDVKLSEVHGMAQRGGSVVTFVRYGDKVEEPIVEPGQADVLIAFERLEAKRYAHYLKPDGVLICNDTRIDPMPVPHGLQGRRDGDRAGTRQREMLQRRHPRHGGPPHGLQCGGLVRSHRAHGEAEDHRAEQEGIRCRLPADRRIKNYLRAQINAPAIKNYLTFMR